jgi:hypothetical protein
MELRDMGTFPIFGKDHGSENACGSGNSYFPNYMVANSGKSPNSRISCDRCYF